MLKRYKGKRFCYYVCEVCGRQISSEEYYFYRKCDVCRWADYRRYIMNGLFSVLFVLINAIITSGLVVFSLILIDSVL